MRLSWKHFNMKAAVDKILIWSWLGFELSVVNKTNRQIKYIIEKFCQLCARKSQVETHAHQCKRVRKSLWKKKIRVRSNALIGGFIKSTLGIEFNLYASDFFGFNLPAL